jgi:hypothetical protein
MALGKRKPKQEELFIPTAKLSTGSGHPFYSKLNDVLAGANFDEFVEQLCAPYYKDGGRPGIPPGVYFRMLLIGYFVNGSATVLRGKGKVGVFQEEVSEDDQFAHEDGEGEFFGFAIGEEAQVAGFENWVVA